MAMPSRSKREYLRRLVKGKNEWSRKLNDMERPAGFLGWHERGYLPHSDFSNLIQFVTFRLNDAMPVSRRREWGCLLKIEDIRERRSKLEEYLDRGVGRCLLWDRPIAKITEDALLHFHDVRYELLAWCIIPNHVHVLVDVRMTPLFKIVQNWKVHVENMVRKMERVERRAPPRLEGDSILHEPGRCPALQFKWQREYWDTSMRDSRQTQTAIRYIENNPVKAGLCQTSEEWAFSSARFRDEYQRLNAPTKEINE